MDRNRFSAVGHGTMSIWNPVGEATLDGLVARLPLPEAPRVLDVGCGPGALLLRLAGRRNASGVGVDAAPVPAERARAAIAAAGLSGRIEIREERFDAARFEPASFDLVACVGATHAVGDAPAALRALHPLVRVGGLLLLGEGFWEKDPDPEYLAAIDARREEFLGFAGARALGYAAYLDLVESTPCSRWDWDRYEKEYAANVERFVADHPDDPDAEAMLARIRPWREAYLRWGRRTLGFGLFLYRRP
jgi:cyclopropane fatty-acyl-phospholipid synthase-like methyltransferase